MEKVKKGLDVIWFELVHAWRHLWKFFSDDPAASCSRMLAVGVVIYVGAVGFIHWDTLTQIQENFLLGYLAGLAPYVSGKILSGGSQLISSLKGTVMDTPPVTPSTPPIKPKDDRF